MIDLMNNDDESGAAARGIVVGVVVSVFIWLALALLLSTCAGTASADRLDEVRARGKGNLCEVATRLRVYGAAGRMQGRPGIVKRATLEMAEHVDKLPMEALWIIADVEPSEQEWRFFETETLRGWTWQDARLRDKSPALGFDRMAVLFYNQCMASEDA